MSVLLEDIVSCVECGKVPVDPVESNCCGCIYCWTCLLDVKNCEDCGNQLQPDQCHSASAVKKMINKFSSYKSQTTGNPSIISANASSKPLGTIATNGDLYNQLRSSANQSFPCIEGCGESFTSVKMETHLLVCGNVQLRCTNPNCTVQCRRKDFEQHVEIECEYKIVNCPYGCSPMKKSEIEGHKALNVQEHLDMLLNRVESQQNEILSIKANPTAVYDSMNPEAFPKRGLLILMCTIALFMPMFIKLPVFILLCVRLYQGLFVPFILDAGKARLIGKGYTIRGLKLFNAICHLWFVWFCYLFFLGVIW